MGFKRRVRAVNCDMDLEFLALKMKNGGELSVAFHDLPVPSNATTKYQQYRYCMSFQRHMCIRFSFIGFLPCYC